METEQEQRNQLHFLHVAGVGLPVTVAGNWSEGRVRETEGGRNRDDEGGGRSREVVQVQ